MREMLRQLARRIRAPRRAAATTTQPGRWSSTAAAPPAVPVHARYLARTIDVSKFQEHFAHSSTQARTFERDSVMLTINTNERRGHVVVFNYGAVVFVNVPHPLRDWCLDAFSPFCDPLCTSGGRFEG